MTTGKPAGDVTSSLGMSMDGEGQCLVARVQASGVLNSETLPMLIGLAHLGMYCSCAELVIDVQALTDFPLRLFTDLRWLSCAADAYRVRFRLIGLTDAISTAVVTTIEHH